MMGNRRLIEMLHLPSRREMIEIFGAGFLIAVLCWYFGVDAWHAILLGCAITVTALAVLVGSSAPDALELSWRPGKRASREGSRSDVANLSSSLRSGWGFVGLTAERQLQQIARRPGRCSISLSRRSRMITVSSSRPWRPSAASSTPAARALPAPRLRRPR